MTGHYGSALLLSQIYTLKFQNLWKYQRGQRFPNWCCNTSLQSCLGVTHTYHHHQGSRSTISWSLLYAYTPPLWPQVSHTLNINVLEVLYCEKTIDYLTYCSKFTWGQNTSSWSLTTHLTHTVLNTSLGPTDRAIFIRSAPELSICFVKSPWEERNQMLQDPSVSLGIQALAAVKSQTVDTGGWVLEGGVAWVEVLSLRCTWDPVLPSMLKLPDLWAWAFMQTEWQP